LQQLFEACPVVLQVSIMHVSIARDEIVGRPRKECRNRELLVADALGSDGLFMARLSVGRMLASIAMMR
jgi:hypothetical protein